MLWIIAIGLILAGVAYWWFTIGKKHNPNIKSNVATGVSDAAAKVKEEADKMKDAK